MVNKNALMNYLGSAVLIGVITPAACAQMTAEMNPFAPPIHVNSHVDSDSKMSLDAQQRILQSRCA